MFAIDSDQSPPILAASIQAGAGQKMALSFVVPLAYALQHAPIGYIYADGYGGRVESISYGDSTVTLTAYSYAGSALLENTRVNPAQSSSVTVREWLSVLSALAGSSSFDGSSAILSAAAYTQGAAVGTLLAMLQTIASCFGLDVYHVSTGGGDSFKFVNPGYASVQGALDDKIMQFSCQAENPEYDYYVLTRVAPIKQRDSVVIAPGRNAGIRYTTAQAPYLEGSVKVTDQHVNTGSEHSSNKKVTLDGLRIAANCENPVYYGGWYSERWGPSDRSLNFGDPEGEWAEWETYQDSPNGNYYAYSEDANVADFHSAWAGNCILFDDQTLIREEVWRKYKTDDYRDGKYYSHLERSGYLAPTWMVGSFSDYGFGTEYRDIVEDCQIVEVRAGVSSVRTDIKVDSASYVPYEYLVGKSSADSHEISGLNYWDGQRDGVTYDTNGDVYNQREYTGRKHWPISNKSEFPWVPTMRELVEAVYIEDSGEESVLNISLEKYSKYLQYVKVTVPKWSSNFDDTHLNNSIDPNPPADYSLEKSSSSWFDPTANPNPSRANFDIPAPSALMNIEYSLKNYSEKIALTPGHEPGILTARWQDGTRTDRYIIYQEFNTAILHANRAVTCTLVSSDQKSFSTASGYETGAIFTLTSDVWPTLELAEACLPYIQRQQEQAIKVNFVMPFAMVSVANAMAMLGTTWTAAGFTVYVSSVNVDYNAEMCSFGGYVIE